VSDRASFADAFRGAYFWPSVTALAGVAIGSVDQYVVNTSMPRVLEELGQPVFYAWVASGFVLAQIVGMSLAGAWRDRAGLRLPFLVGIGVFGVGSMLCAAAPAMSLLVLARAFQGLGGGALVALSTATVSVYPEALRIRMYAAISTLWGIVALCGPLLGGAITDFAGWRWIFLANAPMCIVAAAIALRGLTRSTSADRGRTIPVARSILLAVAVGCLVAAPSAESLISLGLLAAGVAAGWIYLRQERAADVPVIPPATWTGRGPVGSCMLATMFVTGGYIGAGIFLPLYLQGVRGETAFTAGLVLSAGGVSWTVGSLIGVHFHGKWRLRAMRFGAGMIVAGTLSVALQVYSGRSALPFITLSWVCAAIGVGIALLHLMNWVVLFSPASQSGAASAAVQTARLLGSAAGGALMGAVLHGIGADSSRIRLAITAIFLLAALFAVQPATLLRPKLPHFGEQGVERGRHELAAVEA
jgi:MFS family permease